ncbi:hypothetical protein BvCmsSIP014_03777 [Escherichia coli]|nr:hypothetical protein BvCmsSIP014_03777 [Escherichia coli]
MIVLRICLFRPKGVIHDNVMQSLALASTIIQVDIKRNNPAES